MSAAAISPIGATGIDGSLPLINQLGATGPAPAGSVVAGAADFGSILASGMEALDQKIATANDLVRQFAVDDSVPVHQVTLALEEARLAVELAMQVRTRMVETYREFMTMQL